MNQRHEGRSKGKIHTENRDSGQTEKEKTGEVKTNNMDFARNRKQQSSNDEGESGSDCDTQRMEIRHSHSIRGVIQPKPIVLLPHISWDEGSKMRERSGKDEDIINHEYNDNNPSIQYKSTAHQLRLDLAPNKSSNANSSAGSGDKSRVNLQLRKKE